MKGRLSLLLLTVVMTSVPGFAQQVKKTDRVVDRDDRPAGFAVKSLRSVVEVSTGNLLETMKSRYAPKPVAEADRIYPSNPLALRDAIPMRTADDGDGNPLRFRLKRSDNGTVNWMHGDLGHVGSAAKGNVAAYASAARDALAKYAGELKLTNPDDELQVVHTTTDAIGFVHTRFRQVYNSIPIWASELIVHFDRDGSLYAINGTYEPTPEEASVAPSLGEQEALNIVVADLESRNRWAPVSPEVAQWLGMRDPEPELVLYPDADRGMRLAFQVSLHANLVEWYVYLVDAENGQILNRIAQHCTLDPTVDFDPVTAGLSLNRRSAAGLAGSAEFTDANSVDLNGQNQTIRVHRADDGTYFLFWDLDNIGDFTLPNLPENGGAVTISAGNTDLNENAQISFVTSGNNSWTDPASVSAHANMKATYDYYKTAFGRKAINDQDQSLVSVVHVTQGGTGMDNAYWNGRVMAYGNGQQVFKPLAGAKDVAAHEMTHGVISATADLVYQAQPGALNESFADVFGVMNDRDDFFLGEDVMNDGHAALRDLRNPDNPQARSGDPAVNGDFTQPAHMSQFRNLPNTEEGDNGGVHINSGIPNRAAALVIESLGHDATEQIYYRALANYLTRNSQFGDARVALIQSATDLHGAGSPEVLAVSQAFDTVGIVEGGDTTDPTQNDVPAVKGELSLMTFVVADGQGSGLPNGTIAFIDPFSPDFIGVFSDPNAIARVGSQLSTTLDGTTIWFINPNGQLSVIDLSSADGSTPGGIAAAPVIVAEDFFLQQPGDLSNVVVGPIGFDQSGNIVEWIALVSAYDFDATLYFSDLNEIVPVELKPVTTQQGIGNDLIRYPDVVAWSTNPAIPKVAFDALNSVPGFSGTSEYWSIYEIDFVSEQIYNLIPAQPVDISVGNITYSNTNPDIISFNVVTQDEFGDPVFDVALANFETGELGTLGLPSITDDFGNPILLDGERPTFAPDNAFIAFGSLSLNALVFFDLNAGEFSSIPFEGAVGPFAPHWFIFRGDVSDIVSTRTEDGTELPTGARLHPSYPNPFAGRTTIRFEVDESSDIRLEIYDVLGRYVTTLIDGRVTPGAHETPFLADGLTAGVYMARLNVGSRVLTRRMLLVQ